MLLNYCVSVEGERWVYVHLNMKSSNRRPWMGVTEIGLMSLYDWELGVLLTGVT